MLSDSVHNEKELLAQIAEGNENAFRQLYGLYDTMLFSFLVKLTRSADAASEIMQETFLQLWLYRDTLAEVEHPRAYIHRIAANTAHRWMNRYFIQRLALEETSPLPAYEDDALEQLSAKKLTETIARIIEEMPEQRRKIYRLHRDNGLSSREIALQMEISSSTVRNTVAAALKDIRTGLLEAGYTLSAILFLLR